MSSDTNEKRIYIGGLAEDVQRDELEDIFRKFGNIVDFFLSKGPAKFAFVEYDDSQHAAEAIRDKNGASIGGKRIRVQASRKRQNASNGECFKCGEKGHFARDCGGDTSGKRRRNEYGRSSPEQRDNKRPRRSPNHNGDYNRRNDRQMFDDRNKFSKSQQGGGYPQRRSRSRSDGLESRGSSSEASTVREYSPAANRDPRQKTHSYRNNNYRGSGRTARPSNSSDPSGSNWDDVPAYGSDSKSTEPAANQTPPRKSVQETAPADEEAWD